MNLPFVNDASLATAAAADGHGGDPFQVLFHHVMPETEFFGIHLPQIFGLQIYNLQIFQLIAVAVVFALFGGVASAVRTDSGGRVRRIMAGWVAWIRDEMVLPNMTEKDGRKLLPLFLSLFFFIAFMNLLGLIPFGATATASLFVTGGLATITLLVMIVGGMVAQGPLAFWKNLIPHGVPGFLVPLMFVVEIIGLLVKPFALTIRLFANMTGGHLVVLSFLGLIFFFGSSMGAVAGWGSAPIWVGLSVFIMIIEGFVALLQAYIFTLLSIIFVGMCLHPDH